jgi:hypothetical protein
MRDGGVQALLASLHVPVPQLDVEEGDDRFAAAVENIAACAIRRDFDATLVAFYQACREDVFNLAIPRLYKLYVGKNALNQHRNVNGYKDGTYVKHWHGREDNEHLAEIMDGGVSDFDKVLDALRERYATVISA